MSIHLRTRVSYGFSEMEELQRAIGRTFGRVPTQRKRGTAVILGLGLLAVGAVFTARGNGLLPLAVCGTLGALALLWAIFYYPFIAFNTSQASKGKPESEYILEKASIWAIQGQESVRYPYSDCLMLLETEGYIFFIMKNGQGLMLSKANLVGGTADDLRAWMVEKCGMEPTWAGRGRGPAQTRT